MKTILFDLDGTLIQTPKIIKEAFRYVFKKYLPDVVLDETTVDNFLGHTLWETFGEYVDDDALIEIMVADYRQHSESLIKEGIDPYPNAKMILQYLRKKGCQIGVVTSKIKKAAVSHLHLTGLLEDVDYVIGYEDVDKHKPHPDPLLKAIEIFQANKNKTIYIGDHENDIKAAKKAGIQSCAVTYSSRLREMLLEQPDYVIDDLKNLKDLL